MVEKWNSHGGAGDHLMEKNGTPDGVTVERLMVEHWNMIVEQWNI